MATGEESMLRCLAEQLTIDAIGHANTILFGRGILRIQFPPISDSAVVCKIASIKRIRLSRKVANGHKLIYPVPNLLSVFCIGIVRTLYQYPFQIEGSLAIVQSRYSNIEFLFFCIRREHSG